MAHRGGRHGSQTRGIRRLGWLVAESEEESGGAGVPGVLRYESGERLAPGVRIANGRPVPAVPLQGRDDALAAQSDRRPPAAQMAFILTVAAKLKGAGAAADSERGDRLGIAQDRPKRALLRRRRHVGREPWREH